MATRLPLVLGSDGLPQQLQASDSIASSAAGTTSSTAVSTTLPGGVILKAGQVAVTGGTITVTFAAAFPTACVSVVMTGLVAGATTATTDYETTLKTTSTTGFTGVFTSATLTAIAGVTGTVHWQAVGY